MSRTGIPADLTLEDAVDLVVFDHPAAVVPRHKYARNCVAAMAAVRDDPSITHDVVDAWLKAGLLDLVAAHAYHMVIDATDAEIEAAMPS